jgi:hypothetical protein
MAGEFAVINPRRRRKKARVQRRKVRRRRKYARVANPVRRRRRVARRRHNPRRRHYARRNPSFMGMDLGKIGSLAGGYVGTEILGGYLKGMLPAGMLPDANLARIGCKAAVAIGVPLLARRFLPRGVAKALMIGGGVAVAVDLFNTFVKPMIPGLPLADYEQGYISDYEMQSIPASASLSGTDSVYGESVY